MLLRALLNQLIYIYILGVDWTPPPSYGTEIVDLLHSCT